MRATGGAPANPFGGPLRIDCRADKKRPRSQYAGRRPVRAPVACPADSAAVIAVQPDGKILVLGDVENFGGYRGQSSFFEQSVLRYNPNGTLDASFGTNGKALSATFAGGG